ncbi:hypothetical protein HS088_TW22G01245 [Tripterygium wilfordii]|uniref:Uncharacterized protein n=1 Tax=Tripterygium wilfordii TaxID=458696 RepID=A0A7J7C061_TRIWF|nr:hypothetical protein HS088_TW22G01245 [Tripterygium wilfordii]
MKSIEFSWRSVDRSLELRIPLTDQKQRKILFEGTSASTTVTGRIDGKLNNMAVGERNFVWLFEEFSGKSIASSIYVVINSLAAFSSPTPTASPPILLLLNATSKPPLSYASMPFNFMINALTTLPRGTYFDQARQNTSNLWMINNKAYEFYLTI